MGDLTGVKLVLQETVAREGLQVNEVHNASARVYEGRRVLHVRDRLMSYIARA